MGTLKKLDLENARVTEEEHRKVESNYVGTMKKFNVVECDFAFKPAAGSKPAFEAC
jgi:hypothetical protein